MFKAVLLAATISAASALSSSYDPFTLDLFKLNLFFEADAGYQTLYNPTQGRPMDIYDHTSAYSFNLFAWAKIVLTHEVMDTYKAKYDFKLNFLDFTPIGASV